MSTPESRSRMRQVPLGSPLLLAWALGAVLTSAVGAQGFVALAVVAPFCLFGAGMAYQMVLERPRPTADTLMVVLGVGLGSATVVSQTLLVLGVYHPTLVTGVLGVSVGCLMLVREARR